MLFLLLLFKGVDCLFCVYHCCCCCCCYCCCCCGGGGVVLRWLLLLLLLLVVLLLSVLLSLIVVCYSRLLYSLFDSIMRQRICLCFPHVPLGRAPKLQKTTINNNNNNNNNNNTKTKTRSTRTRTTTRMATTTNNNNKHTRVISIAKRRYTNDTLGGLLNASFGNITELVVACLCYRCHCYCH